MFRIKEDIKLLTQNQIGVLYMVGSVICFSIMDICVKWLDYYPVGQVLFLRFFIGFYSNFFIIPKNKLLSFYKTSRPGLHAFRAITGAAAIIALFIGLRGIAFSRCCVFNIWRTDIRYYCFDFLFVWVGIKRWSAVFLGFIGMLLIVQPAFIDLNYYYITPIVFCIFFACVAISVRSLSKTEPNYTIAFLFYFSLYFTWSRFNIFCRMEDANINRLDNFYSNGFMRKHSKSLLTQSYRLAEASLVTPIKYLSLVFAIVFSDS